MNNRIFYNLVRILGYAFVFIGIFIALNDYNVGHTQAAIRVFAFLGILPLALCAFLWHTLWRGQIIETPSASFFEIECGGANLAIGLVLSLAWFLQASVEVVRYVLMVYFIYLLVSAIASWIYLGFKRMLHFLPLLLAMLFFICLH